MNTKIKTINSTLFITGYYLSLLGLAAILLWLGIFKFTSVEALAIKPLMENHPLTAPLYKYLSVQTISNIIGTVEIITALSLILGIRVWYFRVMANTLIILTFLTTLSFLITTPDTFKIIEGVPVTDFFILKDILLLGAGLMVLNSRITKNNEYKN